MIYWPVVKQALLDLLPTLDGFDEVIIHNGQPMTDKGADRWISVGWSSFGPLGGGRTGGIGDRGSFDNDTDETVDRLWAERGSVACELVVWTGDEEAAASIESDAFTLVGTLQRSIRLDQSLGGALPPLSLTSLSAEVMSAQDQSGATQRLIVSVNYFVRAGEQP